MRVPLLAWGPGLIPAGTRIPQMVQNIDIAPTVLEVAGVKKPMRMDGQSMLPLLTGKTTPWRDAVFYEYYWERNFPQTPTVHGIRTDQYKYMHYHGIWDIDEFYDLKNDPAEMHNLINSPEHRAIITDLNRRLFDWLDQTGGMLIPLRRDAGLRMDKRKPEK
jgi:N-acetylglucosamine-6-sulfatase